MSDHSSPVSAWYAVFVLMLLYICSYMDRAVLTMLLPHIQEDFRISNFEISLLIGPVFGIVYTVLGLAAGWLADRSDRRVLVACGTGIWGLATMFSGLANSYAQLAMARLSIGVGEATLTPVAHSIIAERFPPRRLSLALAIYTLGATFGSALSLALSGVIIDAAAAILHTLPTWIGLKRPWQTVFFLVSLPTLLLIPLTFTIGDGRASATRQPRAQRDRAGWDFMRSRWRMLVPYFLGYAFMTIAALALSSWIPTYMARTFHMNMGTVGASYGLTLFISTSLGMVLWASIVDRIHARGVIDVHPRFQAASWFFSLPAVILAFRSSDPVVFLALNGIFLFATYASQGYSNAGLQLITPPQFRGRMAAAFLAFQTLVGTSLGPTSVGFLTDYVFRDPARLGLAISCVVGVCAPCAVVSLWLAALARRRMEDGGPISFAAPRMVPAE